MLATLSKCAASPAERARLGRKRAAGVEGCDINARASQLPKCGLPASRGPRRALARASIKFYLHRKLT